MSRLPLVSVLAVTGRPMLRSWLHRSVMKQDYPNMRIVLIDGSHPEMELPIEFRHGDTSGVHMRAANFLDRSELRNLALTFAQGDYVVWVDDDDWIHPRKVTWLVEAIQASDEPWAGWNCGYVYDANQRAGAFVDSRVRRVFATAGIFKVSAAQSAFFDGDDDDADARWVATLEQRYDTQGEVLMDRRAHSIWVRYSRKRLLPMSMPLDQILDSDESLRAAHHRHRHASVDVEFNGFVKLLARQPR